MNVQKIKDIFNDYGAKHFTRGIRKDKDLLNWINDQTKPFANIGLSERAYIVVNNFNPICPNGNKRSFDSYVRGYKVGCGAPTNCQCARDSKSAKIKAKKAEMTREQIDAANKKREATTLKNYGVTNNGQTKAAKDAHKAFYANEDNVKSAVDKQTKTLQEKYGQEVTNISHIPGIKEKRKKTNIERYGHDHAMKCNDVSSRAGLNQPEVFSRDFYEKSFKKIHDRYWNSLKLEILMKPSEYTGVTNIRQFDVRCLECNTIIKVGLDYRHTPVCKECHPPKPKYRSKEEIQVFNFICEHYSGEVRSTHRLLINPYELDIYLPEEKLAIEYCGLYWHSEEGGKDKEYHRNKFLKCEEKEVQLITMFADDWNSRKDITKNILLNRLGFLENKINASSLEMDFISDENAELFLTENHVQGYDVSHVNVGLYKKNTLMSLMTFAFHNNEWEMVRFANKIGFEIPGASSKLLRYFINQYEPREVIGYSNSCWDSGSFFGSLGFTFVKEIEPSYQYINSNCTNREHWKDIDKSNLLEEVTENEGRILLGYKRVWDCGRRKYRLQNGS